MNSPQSVQRPALVVAVLAGRRLHNVNDFTARIRVECLLLSMVVVFCQTLENELEFVAFCFV